MPVTQQTPFNSFTAAAGATVFSSSFRVIQASDLVVRVNGAVRTTGFVVSGVGAAGGVDVTFSTPMTGGELVELLREVPLTRATDYQQLGDFLSPMVNLDFDRIWMAMQGQALQLGSVVRAPFPEQINALPSAAARAGNLLRFDSAGNPIPSTIGSIGGTVTDASLVEYLPAGTGAVPTNVQSKLRQFPTLEDKGAVGDGVVNDTAAIAAALADAGGFIAGSGKTYLHDPIDHYGSVNISTTGAAPATFLCTNTNTNLGGFSFVGTEKAATTLAAAAPANRKKITVASAANIAVGDLLKIVSPTLWPNDNRGTCYFGQLVKVVRVVGSVVTIDASIVNGLPLGSTVTPVTPIVVNIDNIVFKRPKTTGSVRGILVRYDCGGAIRNCAFENLSRIGLNVSESYKTQVIAPRVVGSNLAISETLGYGIGVGGAYGVKVIGGEMSECRRGVDVGGTSYPSFYCWVNGNTVMGGGVADDGITEFWPYGSAQCDGIGSHGGAEGTVYKGNMLIDVRAGVLIRGRKETVSDNKFVGHISIPVEIVYGAGIVVDGNRYADQLEYVLSDMAVRGGVVDSTSVGTRPERFVYVNTNTYDLASGIIVTNNTATNLSDCFVFLEGSSGNAIGPVQATGNRANIQKAIAGTVALFAATTNKFLVGYVGYGNEISCPADHPYSQFRSVSISKTDATVQRLSESMYMLNIPDDVAAVIKPGTPSGQKFVRVIPAGNSLTPRINKMLRNNSTSEIEFGGSSGMTVSASVLTGTTGVDGTWTISHASGNIYVENRSGAFASVLVEVVG